MLNSELLRKYAIAIIAIAALGTYYPVLSAPFFTLDDFTLLNFVAAPGKDIPLKSIAGFFKPGSIERYFRPLLILSYLFDSKVWFHNPYGYHLTNYILHCLNSIILYGILAKFFPYRHKVSLDRPAVSSRKNNVVSPPTIHHPAVIDRIRFEKWAIAGALLFAVHPLTCESVAWISGRTDILACFFCLASFYFYSCSFKGRGFFCGLFFLAGLFSKESAVALYPIIIILQFSLAFQQKGETKKSVRSIFSWILILTVPLLIYLYLRMDGVNTLDHGVKTALTNKVATDTAGIDFGTIQYITAVISFYIKKLFIPFPLNFAISEINVRVYSLFFCAIPSIALFLLVKREWRFLVWLCLLIVSFSPALLVATSKMAWTPIAERYLYLSVAVWAFLPALVLQRIHRRKTSNAAFLVIGFIILGFIASTYTRAELWRENQGLWADTYEKNPTSGKVLYKYGESLNSEDGVVYFRKAIDLDSDGQWKELSLLALAKYYLRNEEYDFAIDHIGRAISIGILPETYVTAASILKTIPSSHIRANEQTVTRLIHNYESYYSKHRKTITLFQIALLYAKIDDIQNAQDYFEKIINDFPESRYADLAKTRLKDIHSDKIPIDRSGS